MTCEDAVSIAKKKEPELNPLNVSEQEDQFLILMGDEDGIPLINSSVLVVNKKTEECKWVNTMIDYKLVNKPIIKEYKI